MLEDLGLKCLMISGSRRVDLSVEHHAFGTIRLPGAYILREELEKNNIDVEIVDFITFFEGEDLKRLSSVAKQYYPDFITVSNTFLQYDDLFNITRHLKSILPDRPIIVGGMDPTTIDEYTIDYSVYGYGENALIKVLEHYFLNNDLEFKYSGRTKIVDAIHSYPSWPKEDYNYEYRKEDHIGKNEIGTLEFSRGCRFKCKFCNFPILGIPQDTSQKDIQKSVDQLNRNYDQFGITNYIMADETFNDRLEKLDKLVQIQNKLDFEAKFSAFCRLDLVWSYPEQIDMMIESKLVGQHYGIETFNLKAAKIIGKGKQAEIAKETLLKVKSKFQEAEVDWWPSVSMIVGLPHSTPSECIESHEWLKEYYNGHIVWYPLEISTSGANLSAFGENMADYGFEIAGKDIMTPTKKLKSTMWKSKDWTYNEAYELSKQLNDRNWYRVSWYAGYAGITTEEKQSIPYEYIKHRLPELEEKYG